MKTLQRSASSAVVEKDYEQKTDNASSDDSVERVMVDAGSGPIPPVIPFSDSSVPRKVNKGKRLFWWKDASYTTRVTMAFAFVAAMTALVAIGVLSLVWESHFQTYTQENMATLADSTARSIAEVYQETGTLDSFEVRDVARYAESLSEGVGLAVVENPGERVIYDSSAIAIEDGEVSDSRGSLNRTLAPPMSSMEFAPIVVNGVSVGSVRVWVYGSEALLTQADEEFRDNSYQAMAFATVLAIVLASFIGFVFARALVGPVKRITATAKAVKEGDLSARTGLRGEDEIACLGETFDDMAEAVERDRELERRLTTDVAHELRTPLMAIQSTVEAMVDGVFEADERRLETVNAEVQRLSRLVDALLKLSRLENRSTPIKKEVVDLGELVDGIMSIHKVFVNDSGLDLESDIQKGVCVLGDPDLIRQAVANLISNAVRYTPEGGSITVRVKRGDIMGSIAVQDTGIGLSPEEAKMVFSRFWRADAGRARERGGLGIGLSVVKEIVDTHGGWVQVEGAKDEGACFTIHIPLYVPEAYQNGFKGTKTRGKSRKDQK